MSKVEIVSFGNVCCLAYKCIKMRWFTMSIATVCDIYYFFVSYSLGARMYITAIPIVQF